MSRPRGVRTGALIPASNTMLLNALIRSSVGQPDAEALALARTEGLLRAARHHDRQPTRLDESLEKLFE